MPNMNGLEFLDKIMRLRPTPVIMVSSLTTRGADITMQALELGAIDCVAKPSAYGQTSFKDLAEKVKAAAQAKLRPRLSPPVRIAVPREFKSDGRLLAIGSSTGGVEALLAILAGFPANCPPTLITQHLPANFTKSFAARLDRTCAPTVSEARDGEPILPGHIYLAPGGYHLEVMGKSGPRCRLTKEEAINGHRPSVDALFSSVARAAGANAIGVILTGMGRDGAAGLLAMRQAGASTLGQDEATSVVYGMPKAAFEIGAVERQMGLSKIGDYVLRLASDYLETV
jgi:two-component system chemotaxis response regulator CheB